MDYPFRIFVTTTMVKSFLFCECTLAFFFTAIVSNAMSKQILHSITDSYACPTSYMIPVPISATQYSCVDQYEAATLEILPNGTEIIHPFYDTVEDITVRAIVWPGIKPQAYISQNQAIAACKLSNKRLCTLDEWMAACQGGFINNYTYPYGNTYHSGYCNEGRSENPVTQIYGPNATWSETEMNNPQLDQLNNTVSFGGEYYHCQSYFGQYDMSGNLDEWVDYVSSETGNGVFKGGYFVDAKINGNGCYYTTTAHGPDYHDYSLGFRCCSDVIEI